MQNFTMPRAETERSLKGSAKAIVILKNRQSGSVVTVMNYGNNKGNKITRRPVRTDIVNNSAVMPYFFQTKDPFPLLGRACSLTCPPNFASFRKF
jgi:hypothetical protein